MNNFDPSDNATYGFRSIFGGTLHSGPGLYPSQNYGQFSTGGNLHDTFRVDRYENTYGGHTSVYLPGGQHIALPWGK